jgi:hypothetical protein
MVWIPLLMPRPERRTDTVVAPTPPAPPMQYTPMPPPFQGPVRPGDNESTFRDTGSTGGVSGGERSGPGVSGGRSGGGGGGGGSQPYTPVGDSLPPSVPIMPSPPKVYNINEQFLNLPQQSGGTKKDVIPSVSYPIYTEPKLVQEQTGFLVDPVTKKKVPTVELFYVDPWGESVGGGAFISTKRKATEEEELYFKEQTNELIASTSKRTTFDVVISKKNILLQSTKNVGSDLIESYKFQEKQASDFLGTTGLTDERIKKGSDILGKTSPIAIIPGGKEAVSDFIFGSAKDVKDKPLFYGATYGIGRAVGFIIKGAGAVSKSIITGLGASKGVIRASTITAKTAVYGGGAILIGGSTIVEGKRIISSEKPYEELGKTSATALAFGLGYQQSGKSLTKKYYGSFKSPELNLGTDIIQPVSRGGKQLDVGVFGIKSKVPATEVYSDRPIKEVLRNFGIRNRFTALKYEKTLKSYAIDSKGIVISQDGSIVFGKFVTGRAGKNLKTFGILKGAQKPIDTKALIFRKGKLLPLQEKQLKGLTGGIYKEKNLYFGGELQPIKILRKSKKQILIFPKGRRSNIYSTVSEVTPLVEVEGQYSLYGSRLSLKDISKPGKVFGDIESAFKPRIRQGKEIPFKTREYLNKIFPKKDVGGVYFNKPVSDAGIKSGDIFLTKRFKKTGLVGKHETGHFYDYKLNILDSMSPQQKKELYKYSIEQLTKRYGKDYKKFYPTKKEQLREGIAISYEKRKITPIREINRKKPIKIYGESKVLEPIRLEDDGVDFIKRYSPLDKTKSKLTQQQQTQSVSLIQSAKANIIQDTNKRIRNNFNNQISRLKKSQNIKRGSLSPTAFAIQQSSYYGKGTYERTNDVAVLVPRQSDTGSSNLIDKSLGVQNNIIITSTGLLSENKVITSNINKNISKNISKNIVIPLQQPISKAVIKPVQKNIQRQLLKPIQKNITKPPARLFPPIRPGIPKRPGTPLTSRKGFLSGKSKRSPELSLQPTRYQASFTARVLNIRAKKASVLAGGLRIRPILD